MNGGPSQQARVLTATLAPVSAPNAIGFSTLAVQSAIEALEQGDTDHALFWLRSMRTKLAGAMAPELVPSFARRESEEAW